MAQFRREQYPEGMAVPSENDQGVGEANVTSMPQVDDFPESPSSGVGYGGGDDIYTKTHSATGEQGHWEENRRGRDQLGSDAMGGWQGGSRYGTVHPNASPDEAGFGSSGPAGYPDEGGYDGMGGTTGDWDAGYDSEVRGGVPHKFTSEGVVSGAGVRNDDTSGGERKTSAADIEQHQYRLAEDHPSLQKESPYSQQLTQPREDMGDKFQEDENIQGNTKGGTAFDHQKEIAGEKDPEEEGFLGKLKHRLPGHGHEDEAVDDRHSDIKPVDSGMLQSDDANEKPGVMTKLKEKLRPNHDKHYDEIDPEIYE